MLRVASPATRRRWILPILHSPRAALPRVPGRRLAPLRGRDVGQPLLAAVRRGAREPAHPRLRARVYLATALAVLVAGRRARPGALADVAPGAGALRVPPDDPEHVPGGRHPQRADRPVPALRDASSGRGGRRRSRTSRSPRRSCGSSATCCSSRRASRSSSAGHGPRAGTPRGPTGRRRTSRWPRSASARRVSPSGSAAIRRPQNGDRASAGERRLEITPRYATGSTLPPLATRDRIAIDRSRPISVAVEGQRGDAAARPTARRRAAPARRPAARPRRSRPR